MQADPTQTQGGPFPLGATPDADGTNFAIVADGALGDDGTAPLTLCLFDADGTESRFAVTDSTAGVWHTYLRGIGPGQRYGYRVRSTDPSKILLDPYARQVTGSSYDLRAASTPGEDTAGLVPLGMVTDQVQRPAAGPQVPWEHTVIYEAHLKGLTALNEAIGPDLRGTYAGAAHPSVVEYLTGLGVTALELLPVHAHADEPLLRRMGRPNYWGYSTLSFFALHPEYASEPGAERTEFAHLVDTMHRAGIEVLMDVVYNHTCEGGGEDATMLSWRGLHPGYYLDGADLTGTGNTLDPAPLASVRMIVDSLRYYAEELGVDGFRFDLASVLGRDGGGPFDPANSLLTAIATDPVLRTRKLIAEPWDATSEGYALGRFGLDWAEWNDRFRDGVRDFWRGSGQIRDLAYRLAGSEDYFGPRQPSASINFVTAHDGFTLRDLVSYEQKHNDANGQCGTDGTDNNRSANYGVEGEGTSEHPLSDEIEELRLRQARNLAATLLLATGTPMICAGDERWRTQGGNNNPYSTDDESAYLDWATLNQPDTPAAAMAEFFRTVIGTRAGAPALHQGNFFSGRSPKDGDGVADLTWFTESGAPMSHDDWFRPGAQCLIAWFDGNDVRGHGPHGAPLVDDSWLLVLHAGTDQTTVTLPGLPYGDSYTPVIDTTTATGRPADPAAIACGAAITMPARTLWLLRANRPEGGPAGAHAQGE